jgi:hypothetical protein
MKIFVAIFITLCLPFNITAANEYVKGEAVLQCEFYPSLKGEYKTASSCHIFIETQKLDINEINSCYGRVTYNYFNQDKELKTAYRGFLTEFKNNKMAFTNVVFTVKEKAISPALHWVSCNSAKVIK